MAEHAAGDRRLDTGWGRSTRSLGAVVPFEPADAAAVVAATSGRGALARGLGRSYGDQATNAGGVVFDMPVADPDPIVVPTDGIVTLAAGVSIDQVLRQTVPQGWFVPVTPGTRFVTLGGAVAADIHGKNHHVDGSIGQHIDHIELLLADGSLVVCGPETQPDLYWATVGGLGLTGVIVSVRLRLIPVASSQLLVDTERLDDLDALIAAMVAADETARYSVAWIDLMAKGSKLGRSVLTTGDFAPPADGDADPLAFSPGRGISAPPWMPNGVLRPATVKLFNEAWFRRAPRERRDERQSIGRFFHPLDGVRRWNRIYGAAGFLQWQMAIPDDAALLREIVEGIATCGAPSFLAVLKRFGPANPAPLSFPMAGWTLAADFPTAHPVLASTLDRLDRLVVDGGGRIYLAKDGRLDPDLVAPMYPRLDEWRAVRDEVDPHRRWQSDMARRLRL